MALPKPEPGLVLNYAYLWHDEHLAGQEEGRKTRPSVVLLITASTEGETRVIALPVTHRAPADPANAVEIPTAVKKHLGLDGERSWIIVSEGNEFVWPGHDLRKVAGTSGFAYGYLPPKLFVRVRDAFLACAKSRRVRIARRS